MTDIEQRNMIQFVIMDMNNIVMQASYHSLKDKAWKVVDPFRHLDTSPDESRRRDKYKSLMTSVLRKIFHYSKKFHVSHLVFAFDSYSWRRDYYSEYKSNRAKRIQTPEDEENREIANRVMDDLKDFLDTETNSTVLFLRGAEADDLIARWTQWHDVEGLRNIVISTDGDFSQLASERVWVYSPIRGRLSTATQDLISVRSVKDMKVTIPMVDGKWGIERDNVDRDLDLFIKCIRGDSGDNIPSAYPKVRERSLVEVYNNRKDVIQYNAFMSKKVKTRDGVEATVNELYERNKKLIDLTRQPDTLKLNMDKHIYQQVTKPVRSLVGAKYTQFCMSNGLTEAAKMATSASNLLSRQYPLKQKLEA